MKKNNKTVSYTLCSWLLLLAFCMQFAVSFCIKNASDILGIQPLSQYGYVLVTQFMAIFLPCVLLCLYNRSGIKRTFAFKKLKLNKAWSCIGLGICIQPIAILLNMPLHRIVSTSGTPVPAPNNMEDVLYMVLIVCLVPAICEELLLRGMVLTSVKRKGYAFSVAVTTFLFVLMHCEPASVLGHILLGISTAFAVLNTGSVFSGMLVHFSFNACGVLIDYITNKYYVQGGFLGTYEFFVFLGISGLFVSFPFFRRVYSEKIKKYPSENWLKNLRTVLLNIPVIAIFAIYLYVSL